MGTEAHRKGAPVVVKAAILTASSSRSLDSDQSGGWIRDRLAEKGHSVLCHRVVADDAGEIARAVRETIRSHRPDVLLINGGTGMAPRDLTIEALKPLFEKEIPAFGILFTQLSFLEIGSAALLSRAAAGVVEGAAVFCMPGSPGACRLALNSLILPELGHLVGHLHEP